MKRHQLDLWSLIGGVLLTGLGLLFLLTTDPLDLTNGLRNLFGWGVPMIVVLIGLALIAPALRRRSGEDVTELPPPPDPFEPI